MKASGQLDMKDFVYDLPSDRIAQHPVSPRHDAKLLVYRNGTITDAVFRNLAEFIPANATLVFNDTRVIPARMRFGTETGATIEVFLLDPVSPSLVPEQALRVTGTCTWRCTIGNLKRWKEGMELSLRNNDNVLIVNLLDRSNGIVQFRWEPGEVPFAEILERAGQIPLPPYLNRAVAQSDRENYQTVYARNNGAVAAPTAGLHFTPQLLDRLEKAGIKREYVTLHVSAGTFQLVKVSDPREHPMHAERISMSRSTLQHLLENPGSIIPVGTTSVRTLESLFWYSCRLEDDPEAEFRINQHEPELHNSTDSREAALERIIREMDRKNMVALEGSTALMIRPGYKFRMCDALITNFHQPGSTLLLLVAALVGDDWRGIYDHAMAANYRFLSYGDGSLLVPGA